MGKKKSARAKSKAEPAKSIDFETSLAEVEQIVARLESGELNLTESLQQYELGIRRLNQCQGLLEAAEQRVSQLAGFDADGNPITEPLGSNEGSAETGRAGSAGRRGGQPTGDQGSDRAIDGGAGAEDSVDDSPGLF